MQEEQVIYSIETEYFTQCLPLLDKYFGITAGYFNDELQQARCLIPHKEGNTITCSVKENCNLSLLFQHIDYNKLTAQINAIPITPLLEEVLILVAYCIRERQINDNNLNDLIQFHMWTPIKANGHNWCFSWRKWRLDSPKWVQTQNKPPSPFRPTAEWRKKSQSPTVTTGYSVSSKRNSQVISPRSRT